MLQKTCFIILGPTAVGKTALAIDIAKHFQTEIISADSRQCFRELNIGVAKPSDEELKSVKHHFINSHSIHDEVNAAIFEKLALTWCEEIFTKKDVVVMSGGTGLYIRAFCEGLDAIPVVSADVRSDIIDSFKKHGIEWLQAKVKEADPEFYETGEIQNPQRLMRALEVRISTGESILSYRSSVPANRGFNIVKIGLDIPRPLLYDRINKRVDTMMDDGLLNEATALFPFRSLSSLQTVGYTELFEFLEGKISLETAVELIKQHTRNYSKRQLTWFRKDADVNWFSPTYFDEIVRFCESMLKGNQDTTVNTHS
ncbi:MAG TPA: tRNA (adenosine(37)-N6)-dimethylallyltransferase MiaA [Chitinophagaceae bacterium]